MKLASESSGETPRPESNVRLPFALNAVGRVVSVYDVPNGLSCNCKCPGCGAILVAKQGMNAWHFAHYDIEACHSGYESALHLAIKQVISESRQLVIPACFVYCSTQATSDGINVLDAYHYADARDIDWKIPLLERAYRGYSASKSELTEFDHVVVEQTLGDIKPDLIGVIGSRQLLIEVAVTHFVDAKKLWKIRACGLPAIEISLPKPDWRPDWPELRKWVIDQPDGKKWLYHPELEALAEEMNGERQAKKEAAKGNFEATHAIRFLGKDGGGLHLFLSLESVKIFVYHPFQLATSKRLGVVTRAIPNMVRLSDGSWEAPSDIDIFKQLVVLLCRKGFIAFPVRMPVVDELFVMDVYEAMKNKQGLRGPSL